MTVALMAAAEPIADLEQARFDRALAELQLADPGARVALDQDTGLAVGADVCVQIPMPSAAYTLLNSDRAAAASVMFLDQHGALFGVSGWHVLEPQYASPIGEAIWFTFAAKTRRGDILINVCTKNDTVLHVRIA